MEPPAEPSEPEGTLTRGSISAVVKVGDTAGRYPPEEVAMSAQIRGPAYLALFGGTPEDLFGRACVRRHGGRLAPTDGERALRG